MAPFELLERDGLARIGRFETPHGRVDTPALLPVVHPDPRRHPFPIGELRRRFGVNAVITSGYIAWRTPPVREVAERDGIHRALGFDGAIMTDSGAFQQHAYGSVEVGPEEILAFQERIGSDIATPLDVFTEPSATREEAERDLDETARRTRAARTSRPGLLVAPVQGGLDPALRARAAADASGPGDVLAVGGVVPLLEQYRFRELAGVLAAARPSLDPGKAVHLFGTGHPMTFAFAALFGVDLFDSSAYQKFARRDCLLFPEGTVRIADVRESVCRCGLCEQAPLTEVAGWSAPEREARLALHNLLVSFEEIARVRQAIRDEALWELVERRAAGHPSLRAGLRAADASPETFWPTEPESRRAFRETGAESVHRPAVTRFLHRAEAFGATSGPSRPIDPLALTPEYLRGLPSLDRSGHEIPWAATTPLGLVPLVLTELYPVGPYLGLDEFESPRRHRSPERCHQEIRDIAPELDADWTTDWTDAWTGRHLLSILTWTYGAVPAARIASGLRGVRSRRTGRLRRLVAGSATEFVVGNDGLPHPTWHGAPRLLSAVPPGRHRVVVADDAVPFVAEGRSLFAKFAVSVDPALVPGSSAVLVNGDGTALAVGRLLLAPHEMRSMTRGVAVRVTAHRASPDRDEPEERNGASPGGPPEIAADETTSPAEPRP